jgi:hypothetical protein
MYAMKKESGYSTFEIFDMYPFELEIYHAMCIKDIKDRVAAKSTIGR